MPITKNGLHVERMTRILLFGCNGQVGRALQQYQPSDISLTALTRADCALERSNKIYDAILEFQPNVIINAAAYTNVEKAQSDQDNATAINSIAPKIMAETAKEIGAILVHYSTDYVFDGKKQGAYHEDDATNPINHYGVSKRDGEHHIINSGCDYYIFRTSWVYYHHGHNFISTMIRLMQEKPSLSVVYDQYGTPTSADFIAKTTWQVIAQKINYGLYHLCPSGDTNWHEFAQLIHTQAQQQGLMLSLTKDDIMLIPSHDYKTAATRPYNSRLNASKIANALSIALPDWRDDAISVIKKIIQEQAHDA